MSGAFITVATFKQSFEAQLAKNLLANEGIECILSGELSSDVLFGGAMVGDQIVLQVPESEVQRAVGLLAAAAAEARLEEDWEEQAESAADVWVCSLCGEPVSNRLSICYSCQTPRDAIRGAAGVARADIQRDPPTPRLEPITRKVEPMPHDDEQPPRASEADDLAHRAFRASLFFPLGFGILQPLSWYYLARLFFCPAELSAAGERRLYAALFVNGLVLLFWFLLGRALMRY